MPACFEFIQVMSAAASTCAMIDLFVMITFGVGHVPAQDVRASKRSRES